MSEFGFDGPPEIDPDIAQIQAAQRGTASQLQTVQLPATAFVAALNGQGGNITLGAGSLPAGVGVTFTNGVGTVSLNLTGIDAIATKKSNLVAAVAPAVTDDSGAGYSPGSIWLDLVLDDAYICLDASVAAAVWKKLTP